MCGYEPSVTDASKPKKQIYEKCAATPWTESFHNQTHSKSVWADKPYNLQSIINIQNLTSYSTENT